MNGAQVAIVAGLCIGLGLMLIVVRLVPTYPNLGQALTVLSPVVGPIVVEPRFGWQEKVGGWALAKLPSRLLRTRDEDLRLLGISREAFLGKKLVYALVGLCLPGVAAALLAVVGVGLSAVFPAVASLLIAAVMFFLPDLTARDRAAALRREFTWALASYIDLVALERYCGSGAKQALDSAAEVGDSWVFKMLRESLDQATWAGKAPWEGLRAAAEMYALPELSDLADIMRLTGSQGVGVYKTLRARAQSMRTAMMADDLSDSNEANEKMSIPVSVLGIVFLAILIGPALLGMLAA